MQYDQYILVGMAKGWKDARTEGTVSGDYFKTERNCSLLVIIYEWKIFYESCAIHLQLSKISVSDIFILYFNPLSSHLPIRRYSRWRDVSIWVNTMSTTAKELELQTFASCPVDAWVRFVEEEQKICSKTSTIASADLQNNQFKIACPLSKTCIRRLEDYIMAYLWNQSKIYFHITFR